MIKFKISRHGGEVNNSFVDDSLVNAHAFSMCHDKMLKHMIVGEDSLQIMVVSQFGLSL